MYEYDFGDFWEHEIRVEAREQPSADKPWPVCTDGARAGPPEDIGGPGGYERLLERLDELRFDQEMAWMTFWMKTIPATARKMTAKSGRQLTAPGSTVQMIRCCATIQIPSIAAPSISR